MNTKLIIWILGIFLGAILIGIIWYFLAAPKTVSQQPSQSSTTLPVSGSVGTTTATGNQQTAQMVLATPGGTAVITHDFIHNGTTIPDKANVGRYLLAGNLGYCPSDPQQCQAAQASDFSVYYNSAQQSFTIALTKEPIGQSRLDMQQFLLTTLGITEQQMCSLDYYVGTTYEVNSTYDDRNLGFSFCPDVTALPQ